MAKNIIMISDLPGYGKVALSTQIPIFAKMGFEQYFLPTALVSNTLNYGKFEILTTTDYLKKSFEIWKELGFEFDSANIGFLGEYEQIAVIEELLAYYRSKNPNFIASLDPIMADEGKLYNGIYEDTIEGMRELSHLSDYITPNWTESCFLTGKDYQETTTREYAGLICEKLHKRCKTNVVITSVPLDGEATIAVYEDEKLHWVDYEEVDVQMTGTGDIFSAVTLGNVLNGNSLRASVKKAAEVVRELLLKNKDIEDTFVGIPIEKHLDEINFLI